MKKDDSARKAQTAEGGRRGRGPDKKPRKRSDGMRELRRKQYSERSEESRLVLATSGASARWAGRARGACIGRKWFRIGLAPDLLDYVESHRGEDTISDFLDGVLAKAFGIKRDGDGWREGKAR